MQQNSLANEQGVNFQDVSPAASDSSMVLDAPTEFQLQKLQASIRVGKSILEKFTDLFGIPADFDFRKARLQQLDRDKSKANAIFYAHTMAHFLQNNPIFSGIPVHMISDSSTIITPATRVRTLEDFTLNSSQLLAVKLICPGFLPASKRPRLMRLVGSAGVGKSRVINCIKSLYPPNSVLLCAPTGQVAKAIDGFTVHSLFGLSVAKSAEQKLLNSLNKEKLQKLQAAELIIIDEAYMLSSKQLELISERLCKVFGSKELFGGKVRMLLCGDPMQLPPVDGNVLYDATPSIGKDLWQEFKFCIELTTPMRQTDPTFLQILSRLRTGECHPNDIEFLLSKQDWKNTITQFESFSELLRTTTFISGLNLHVAIINALCQALNSSISDACILKSVSKAKTARVSKAKTAKVPAKSDAISASSDFTGN